MTLKDLIARHPKGILELELIPFYLDGGSYAVEIDLKTLRPHKAWRICADGMEHQAKEDCRRAVESEIGFIVSSCEGAEDWEEIDGRHLWVYGNTYPDGDPTQPPIAAALWFTPNPDADPLERD